MDRGVKNIDLNFSITNDCPRTIKSKHWTAFLRVQFNDNSIVIIMHYITIIIILQSFTLV